MGRLPAFLGDSEQRNDELSLTRRGSRCNDSQEIIAEIENFRTWRGTGRGSRASFT
jgi:hypothetical protein